MIELEVISPERQILKLACVSVTLPGREGELEVLEGHTPTLIALKTGVLTIKGAQSNFDRMMVSGGFAEIDDKHVRVLAEVAATPDEIDAKSEEELIAKIKEKMSKLKEADDKEFRQLQASIERSMVKIQIL